MKLRDKVALVTGAARGIGLAIAERFVAEGAKVVLSDIDAAEGRVQAGRLSQIGQAVFIPCDVRDAAAIAALVEGAAEAFTGDIDVLVNNAGVVHNAEFLDLDPADFDRVLAINLKAPFLLSQAVGRRMARQVKAGKKPGAIINMASINAQVAIATQVPYSISKGGLLQLTRVSALALSEYGIRVNAIGPGSIATDMVKAVAKDDAARRVLLSRTPLRRFGDASEIASIALFLASDDASYVTGETIYADGGRLALNYLVPVEE